MSLLVVGSIAYDTIDTPHGRAENVLGGSAVHFAMAAALLCPVRMVGHVGMDMPDDHLQPLRARGIDLSGVIRKDGRTFRWSGRYSSNMNMRETLSVELNVFGEHAPELPPEYRTIPYLFLANGSPAHQLYVMDQMEGPCFAVLDTMDHWIKAHKNDLERLFKRVQGVVVNDSEAQLLTGMDHIHAARQILEMGPEYVIVKKGEHGAVMVSKDSLFVIPAFPTFEVRDPTGAGDSFAGGVMGYLARVKKVNHASLCRAVAYGTVIASFNVEDFGARRMINLSLQEVEQRMAQFRGILQF